MAIARDPLYRDFGPTLLVEHLERSFGVRVSVETLRNWMLEEGLWERWRRRAKHRRRRKRRAALGELGPWDSSVHRWLEARAGQFVLISIHDDATSRLMMARFVERDDGAENRRAIIGYLRSHARPLAVYTDHAGHFGQWLSRKEERTDTIIARGLDVLGVEVILAGSPQAKGRVERSFGTTQDRLSKEMRVAGIDTLGGANRFLAEWWTPFWNERFTVDPRDPMDAHRRLPAGGDLEALFAETETREVQRDFTIRFRNVYWQIPEQEAVHVSHGSSVVVELRLNGRPASVPRIGIRRPSAWGARGLRPRPPPPPEKPARARAPSHPAQSQLRGADISTLDKPRTLLLWVHTTPVVSLAELSTVPYA